MPLSRHSAGTIRKRAHTQLVREHSVTVAEPLLTDPGIKSGIKVHELIATLKEKKKEKSAGGK